MHRASADHNVAVCICQSKKRGRPIIGLPSALDGYRFVAEDAANFGIVQMVVAILLITALVALAAFWEAALEWFKERKN